MTIAATLNYTGASLLLAAISLSSACSRPDPPEATASTRAIVQGEFGQQLDHSLTLRADSGFNGTVLIAAHDRIILHKGYGWVDNERSEPVLTTTPFWIASISKQFAAAAVLKLEEQGRLSLGNSITRFFAAVPPEKQDITLHQLLTHTAGLEQHYAADGVTDRDEAVRAILAHPLVRPSGQSFGYSNDAYNLIAAVVEVAARQPYEIFLREQLLEPANLLHTGFWGPAGHPEVAAILQDGWSNSTIREPNWGFRGAVGMFSTSGDLYSWYQALQDNVVLSKVSRNRLFTPHLARGTIGVGYGWFVSPAPDGTASVWTRGYESFGHGAVLATYPDARVVIAVASSSGEQTPGVPVSHSLAEELGDLVLTHR